MDRCESKVCRMGEDTAAVYWDAARANVLLDVYVRLERSGRELQNLLMAYLSVEKASRELTRLFLSEPFGNLAAALKELDRVKEEVCAG